MGNRALYSYNYTIPEPADGVYTKYEQACVSSGKIKEHQSKTVEECELLCDAKSTCKSFTMDSFYGGSGGHTWDLCTLFSKTDRSGCDGKYYNNDLYVQSQKPNLICDDPDLRLVLKKDNPPSGYRHVYIDELFNDEGFKQQVIDKVGRFELAYVINGSIYGNRVGNSVNEDCGNASKRIVNMIVAKDCYQVRL